MEAKIKRDEVAILSLNCQKDYDDAIPILQSAQDAVKSIDKTQLQILKTFNQPHILVKNTLEATCLLFGYEETWEAAKKYTN